MSYFAPTTGEEREIERERERERERQKERKKRRRRRGGGGGGEVKGGEERKEIGTHTHNFYYGILLKLIFVIANFSLV
jgi:hypothetical protein